MLVMPCQILAIIIEKVYAKNPGSYRHRDP
jgi:hypothetical protein